MNVCKPLVVIIVTLTSLTLTACGTSDTPAVTEMPTTAEAPATTQTAPPPAPDIPYATAMNPPPWYLPQPSWYLGAEQTLANNGFITLISNPNPEYGYDITGIDFFNVVYIVGTLSTSPYDYSAYCYDGNAAKLTDVEIMMNSSGALYGTYQVIHPATKAPPPSDLSDIMPAATFDVATLSGLKCSGGVVSYSG